MIVRNRSSLVALLATGAAFLGTAFLAAEPATADVKAGVDAWSRGDYEVAVREWTGPAAQGDPDALFNLAQAYKLGRGVGQDLARAESLYQQAAARGHHRAADNYGLLLFQRGERAKAIPFIQAGAIRGDPRAQYVLGLAHFNGDLASKDWVRAYALVSLAQQAGLPQAAAALEQMDKYVPLEQRQQSVMLASELAAQAAANRASQVAARDLGTRTPVAAGASAPTAPATPAQSAERAVAAADKSSRDSPASAGADYARPRAFAVASAAATPVPEPTPGQATKPAPLGAERGTWRVQLGAFGVAANANRLWAEVRGRPELAGRTRVLVPDGPLTKLQAGGFQSRAEAEAACSRLKPAGIDCLAVED